ncbi:MAG: hypothetical protein JJE23_04745 [Thermoleophilia bacterium]|nr:hypothetical protein [Thermoleophilia bacterium]
MASSIERRQQRIVGGRLYVPAALRRSAKVLKKGKRATAKLSVTLTDLAANSKTEKLKVTLRR